nr:MAG TPA: hypothetical protein [Caudoviricetes sp.]
MNRRQAVNYILELRAVYAGRERASSTSAPPFYILFKYIHKGGCILRSLLR